MTERARRPGGYCGAFTTLGSPCQTRTRDGGPCAVHKHHDQPSTQARTTVIRCSARIGEHGKCFQRVPFEGDLCRYHKPQTGNEPSSAVAVLRRLRAQLEKLVETVDELLAITGGGV